MNKTLYFILPIILVLGVYGTHASSELSGYFHAYKLINSTNILTVSIPRSSYGQGQTIHVYGKVNHSSEGVRVIFHITDPDKNAEDFSSYVDRYGLFNGSYIIPITAINGKYLLTAYYDGDSNKKIVSFKINISDTINKVYILIPFGASQQANNKNFDPPAVTVRQGAQITWINNDDTVHTVISGAINNDGTYSPDNRFVGGFVGPGKHLVVSPDPGSYSYFCQLHPWLGGTITVKANPVPAKTPVKPSTTAVKTKLISVDVNASSTAKTKSKVGVNATSTAKVKTSAKSKTSPVSNIVLTTIWKERKDLQKLYPEVAHGSLGNLTKWAKTTGWNQDKRLAALIPPGKVPDYVLTTIWKERKDLQKLYPEVAHGSLGNLTKWATSTGWNQDKRLAALIPRGNVPAYLDSVLITIWGERTDLQKLYPEVDHGSLGNLTKWATSTGWNQDKRLAALIPPGQTPKY